MNNVNFDFGNAIMHFQKTGGPKGFLWKFGLAYGVCYFLLMAVYFWSFSSVFAAAFDPDFATDPYAMEMAMADSIGQIMMGYLIMFIGGIVLYMVFEAASQRRYMRGEGFSLRLGADEFRLLAVGFLLVLVIIGIYVGGIIVVGVPVGMITASGGDAGGFAVLLAFILGIAYIVFALWLLARFSPAAALTIRDRSIQFAKAWGVTKGKAWTIVGSWVVLYLAMMVIAFVMYFIIAAIMISVMAGAMSSMSPDQMEDPVVLMNMFMSPALLVPMALVGAGYMFISAIMWHVFGGPAALAARTDPNWADGEAINQTFL